MTADADRPGHQQLARRRQADRDFLSWLHLAPLAELQSYALRTLPRWRRVAVEREVARRC